MWWFNTPTPRLTNLNTCAKIILNSPLHYQAMWHHSLLLMNSFNKTEAAVFSCRLCFLGAYPFISLIVRTSNTLTELTFDLYFDLWTLTLTRRKICTFYGIMWFVWPDTLSHQCYHLLFFLQATCNFLWWSRCPGKFDLWPSTDFWQWTCD